MYRVYVYPSLIADSDTPLSSENAQNFIDEKHLFHRFLQYCVLAEAEAAPLTHATNY